MQMGPISVGPLSVPFQPLCSGVHRGRLRGLMNENSGSEVVNIWVPDMLRNLNWLPVLPVGSHI